MPTEQFDFFIKIICVGFCTGWSFRLWEGRRCMICKQKRTVFIYIIREIMIPHIQGISFDTLVYRKHFSHLSPLALHSLTTSFENANLTLNSVAIFPIRFVIDLRVWQHHSRCFHRSIFINQIYTSDIKIR